MFKFPKKRIEQKKLLQKQKLIDDEIIGIVRLFRTCSIPNNKENGYWIEYNTLSINFEGKTLMQVDLPLILEPMGKFRILEGIKHCIKRIRQKRHTMALDELKTFQ